MSQYYNILTEMLSQKQMSISSIARELKKSGYEQHRLILTGYLRALHDLGYLEEIDIPPSIVYTFNANMKRDIYTVLKERLKDMDASERLEVAVFLLSTLLHRPVFRYELELLGIEAQRTKTVKESRDSRLKEHRASVTRIKIPNDDPAFEISGDMSNLMVKGNEILIEIINELIDLEGLKAKFQQTRLA